MGHGWVGESYKRWVELMPTLSSGLGIPELSIVGYKFSNEWREHSFVNMEGSLLRQYGGCLTVRARLSCPRTGRRNEVLHAHHLEVAECIVEDKGQSPTTMLVPMCTPRLVADTQIRQ